MVVERTLPHMFNNTFCFCERFEQVIGMFRISLALNKDFIIFFGLTIMIFFESEIPNVKHFIYHFLTGENI